MMSSLKLIPCFVRQLLIFFIFVKAISNSSGILIIKDNAAKNNVTNFLDPNIKVNFTDNGITIPTKLTPTPHTNHKTTNTSLITSTYNVLDEFWNKSRNIKTKSLSLSTTPLPTNHTMRNFTTLAPHHHKKKTSGHNFKILFYTLIPVSVLLLLVAVYFIIRHVQKVKRKRRLERELIHQYSYPNSEAGDLDDDDRLFEVESIINTQFHATNDQEEKNFVAEIPQVTVAIGEGSKLVIEEESPLISDGEASTSFNC